MDSVATIRSFVAALLARRGDSAVFSDDESLVARGRLDSVDVMEIVMFLEEQFGIDLGERGFNLDDYDSVARMAALVEQLQPPA